VWLFTEKDVLHTYDGAVDVIHFRFESLDKSESEQGATGQRKEEEPRKNGMGWKDGMQQG